MFWTLYKALGALLLEEDSEFDEAIGLNSASALLVRSESPDVEGENFHITWMWKLMSSQQYTSQFPLSRMTEKK